MEIEIAGVVFLLHPDRIEISRRGRPELPGAVLRFGVGDQAAEVDLYLRLSAGNGPDIERRVLSIPAERVVRWFAEFQEDLGRRFVGELVWTTPEDLAERGYVVLAPGPEHNARWLEHLAPSQGEGMRVVNPEGFESPEAAAIMLDSAIAPAALRDICVSGEKRDTMWAVDSELVGPTLMVLWLETGEGWRWAAVPLDSWGEQLQEAMRSRMPAGVDPLMESLIRHLCLEELGFDHKRLASYDVSDPGAARFPAFDTIATRHAARANDIEHFASVGAFAASTAERALPGGAGGGFAELEGFRREIARHAICRLLESAEIAIGETRNELVPALWDARWREGYDAVSRSRGESGEDRARDMMKALGGRLDGIEQFALLNKLRHGWTHRSSIADPRLFTDLGRNGKELETLAWSGVALELRLGEEVVVDQRHVTATRRLVTRLVDALAEEVAARLGSRAEGPDSGPPAA